MMLPLLDQLVAYEQGDLSSSEEIVRFYAELVRTGAAWQLQGTYGRTAMAFINAGLISLQGDVL